MICCSRLTSVTIVLGSGWFSSTTKSTCLDSAKWRKPRSTERCRSSTRSSLASTATVPDSILDRSRMSLISISRSLPDEWIVLENSTCLADRLPSGFLHSWSDRISRLLSGVRSSCDMLARNSDLYLDVSASCSAFSSSAWRACSTSWFLRSTSWFWCASSRALSPQLLVGLLQLLLARAEFLGQRLRLLEQVLGARVRLDGVDHDADRLGQLVEEGLVHRVEALQRRQLEHAAQLAFEHDRQHQHVHRGALAEARGDAERARRHVGQQHLALVDRALADQALRRDALPCRACSGRPTRSSRTGAGAATRRRR